MNIYRRTTHGYWMEPMIGIGPTRFCPSTISDRYISVHCGHEDFMGTEEELLRWYIHHLSPETLRGWRIKQREEAELVLFLYGLHQDFEAALDGLIEVFGSAVTHSHSEFEAHPVSTNVDTK